MKSIPTKIMEKIKNFLILSDYLIWLLFDLSKFKKINKRKIKKVLIIHLGSIGELIVTTPLFPALKKALNCKISYMVGKGKEAILKNNPYVLEIFTPKSSFKKNVENIKKKNFDLVIILYPASLQMCLVCFLAEIKYRIGCFPCVKGGPSFFLTRRVFPINKKNAIEKNLEMIEQIGIYSKNPKLEFYLSAKEKKNLKRRLNKLKVKDYAIIHPGGSFITKYKYSSKLWPLDRYTKITDYLIKKYKVTVFITGSKDEKIISEKIAEKVKNKKNIIVANELFDFRELAALVSQAKLVISHGTGIVHVAAAFCVPTVVFEGKGEPQEWTPWNLKKNCKMLFHPEVCTGCDKNHCRKKTQECMFAITLKEVINAADELLKSNYFGFDQPQ